MLGSDMPEVAREGAREVAARWLFHGYFEKELELCANGPVPLRIGTANIMAQFVADPDYHDKAMPFVSNFLSDESKEVRTAAYRCVQDKELLNNNVGRKIISECIQSQAFVDDPTHVLDTLDNSPGELIPFADLVTATASRFANDLAEASQDASRGHFFDVNIIGRLLLRLYEEAMTESHDVAKEKCLDMWDLLLQQRVGVRDLFDS